MSGETNITYTSDAIRRYYGHHRIAWDQFYPSERALFERIAPGRSASVLDIGCGCAGLGLALRERFGVTDYTGIEINAAAAEEGRNLFPEAKILTGDFLEIAMDRKYEFVVSLSCIDWNVEFGAMLGRSYELVKDGGMLVVSLRLTDDPAVSDMLRAWQYINFEGRREGEMAPYVICSAPWIFKEILKLQPTAIIADGYWSKPSQTADVRYERLCFAVFAIAKGRAEGPARVDLNLPSDIKKVLPNDLSS